MIYLAFNLEDFHHNQSAGSTRVGVKFIEAKNLRAAKEFMARFYPETAWAVVSKRTFDAGIVHYEENS
jgi:hypothetical protein